MRSNTAKAEVMNLTKIARVELCQQGVLCTVCKYSLFGELAITCTKCHKWQCKTSHEGRPHVCTFYTVDAMQLVRAPKVSKTHPSGICTIPTLKCLICRQQVMGRDAVWCDWCHTPQCKGRHCGISHYCAPRVLKDGVYLEDITQSGHAVVE